ncbi:MAG: citrate synthase/methylcitrate synthase [Acidobacteriota bacterium]
MTPSGAPPSDVSFRPGLAGIVAAETSLSRVEGEAGRLTLRGYPLEEIAPRASFEEMVFLLWEDRLPTARELHAFRQELASRRRLAPATLALLAAAAEGRVGVMDALVMGAASLALDPTADERTLVACVPSLVATYARLAAGDEPIPVRPDLGLAAGYLWQLTGEEPSAERVRGLETYLNTVCDHGFNASTFTARVIVSTGSDGVSSVVGALGALKGPLHGGAPGPALDMVREIGVVERAEDWLRAVLDRGERLMGFGHRVYRVRDPRADVLAAAAEGYFARGAGDRHLWHLARGVEEVALRLLRERKPDRRIETNVEFYTALLLDGLGLPTELFSPTFAIGRVAGWTAHGREQRAEGRLIRPSSTYVGAQGRRWVPLDERG